MGFVKRICLLIICLLAFLISALSGCTPSNDDEYDFVFDNKYNATLYDQAIDFNWFSEEYLMENLLNKCVNGNLDIYDNQIHHSDTGEVEIIDILYPTKRTNVITTREEFERVFVEFPDEVDFEKQILILFFRGDNVLYGSDGKILYSSKLKAINIEKEVLSISISSVKMVEGPTGSPLTRECYIVKMDKVQYESIEVSVL